MSQKKSTESGASSSESDQRDAQCDESIKDETQSSPKEEALVYFSQQSDSEPDYMAEALNFRPALTSTECSEIQH